MYNEMENKVIGTFLRGFILLMSVTILVITLIFAIKEIKSTKKYNYPVIFYRYVETQGILFSSEKVEVIYETDSETVKKTYFLSSIEIGEKTEVVVQKADNSFSKSKLYMTKEDYESLISSAAEQVDTQ